MVEISRVPYLPAAFSNPFKRKHYTGAIDRVPISEQKKSLKGGEGLDYAIMNFVQQNLHTAFTDVFFFHCYNARKPWAGLAMPNCRPTSDQKIPPLWWDAAVNIGSHLSSRGIHFEAHHRASPSLCGQPQRPFADPSAKRLFLPIQPFFFLLCCGNHAVFSPQKGWNCGSCIGFSDCF